MKQGIQLAAAFLVCSALPLPVQAQERTRPEAASSQSITGTIVRNNACTLAM